MHIPDGYLSPSTCAALYASASPFWYVALKRLKRQLHTRMVPLVSVFSAFSFVVMMFNLPLPGGTTGHATGVGLATVVLGPWASMLAVSIALVIQALFFGDGGVTAIGANCFNIAIVGSLAAWAVYRMIAGNTPVESNRRKWAAGLAGYVGINAAALITAIEFGLQPAFFQDASGAPLYAPYPLHIAVPAMMLGHLTLAGLAEFVVSAGVVAYLQKSDPALLSRASGIERESPAPSARKLWAALAVLMILTPLGLLAVGSAWGEWSPADFANAETRKEIAAASRGVSPPAAPPSGLERVASVWTAPIPDYAPPMFKSPAFGYVMSAMLGSGLIVVCYLLLTWTFGRGRGDV
ncbi:MAG TPA: cobalt transporter CbiM [Bryobacteraceae bacterium]|nr:cobalt transporter CbiM [Bryobacteraceae bacterium]